MSHVILIPAYQPDEKLLELVRALKESQFDILIVDDGSDPSCSGIFREAESFAKVLHHEQNQGKGAALKTGIAGIAEFFPEAEGLITADADGQHLVEDILRVRKELTDGRDFVVSVRNFRKDTPFLSKFGNSLSRIMYALFNKHYLPDNQSGLRGFAAKHFAWMLHVPGVKYDYEFNVLLYAEKQGIRIDRLPIQAVYFDGNARSNFRPVQDTLKIYRQFFRTFAMSLVSGIAGIALVAVHMALFGFAWFPATIFLAWALRALLCEVVERYTLFRKINYTPGARRLVFSIFEYFLYTVICFPCRFIGIPLIVGYLIAMVLVAVGEYFVLKVAYD